MSKLNLVPNPVIGYRVHPDQWNWTVVVVKKHGAESKNAGQQYETALAYCKDLSAASQWILRHVAKMEGRRLQDEEFDANGNAASIESLMQAFEKAQQAVAWMVQDFEQRLKEKGVNLSQITRHVFAQPVLSLVKDEILS